MLYPNPTYNELNINLMGLAEGVYTFKLLSINGVSLHEEQLTESTTVLDLSHINKGIYFAEVTSTISNQRWVGKVVLIE